MVFTEDHISGDAIIEPTKIKFILDFNMLKSNNTRTCGLPQAVWKFWVPLCIDCVMQVLLHKERMFGMVL